MTWTAFGAHRKGCGLRGLRGELHRSAGREFNGASELLGEIFGEAGQHARSAVGVPVLPLDSPVEVEIIVEYVSISCTPAHCRCRLSARPRRSAPLEEGRQVETPGGAHDLKTLPLPVQERRFGTAEVSAEPEHPRMFTGRSSSPAPRTEAIQRLYVIPEFMRARGKLVRRG